jgi:hypothetical protein
MSETLAQTGFAMPEPFFGMDQRRAKLHEISSTKVFEFASLEQIPHPFLRIQLRRIGRQAFQMKAFGAPSAQKVFDDARTMNRRTVPNDQQVAGNFAQKHLQEAHDIWPFVRVILDLHEQSTIWRQSADGRQVVTGQRNSQDGRLPHGRRGSHGHGQQVERRLIYEDDGTRFLFRLFFNSATRCSRQVWIACASRWLARLSGFWTLCLIALRRRPQWVG